MLSLAVNNYPDSTLHEPARRYGSNSLMYEAFYGLNEKPFNLTPDPRFLYLSSKHKEAFAHLLYGIRNRCGFVMVSGEIGTGKTTICRSLLKQLDPDTEVAFIFNPKLSPIELLQTINADFGIASKADTVRGLIDELNVHLLKRAGLGKNCVLIIDEAQNLGTDTLEQIRLLSNLETETEKLLQIVLIGQPELSDKLALPELRQLNQRITARYHLGALNSEETLHYIAFRLRVAGGRKKVKFAGNAVRSVHRHSGGTPRVINALCDRALLIGYTKEIRQITPAIVRKAAYEIRGTGRIARKRTGVWRWMPVSVAAVAAIAAAAGLFAWGPLRADDLRFWSKSSTQKTNAAVTESAVLESSAPSGSDFNLALESQTRIPPAAASTSAQVPPIDGIAAALPQVPAATPAGGVPSTADEAHAIAPNISESATKVVDESATPEKMASLPPAPEVPIAPPPRPHEGLAELVRAWDREVVQAPPAEITPSTVLRFASANGLRMFAMSPNATQLANLDMPALVRLNSQGPNRWAALMRLNETSAKLVNGDGSAEEMLVKDFRASYAGECMYIWNDLSPKSEPLRAKVIGDSVISLQEDLQRLGLINHDPTGAYDVATIDAISRIQRATGVDVDGVAGPQTRMVLNSWLKRAGAPNLSPDGYDDALRDRILSNPGIVARAPAPAQELESIPLPEIVPVDVPISGAQPAQETAQR